MSRWNDYKNSIGSTTNTSGASYYSGNDSFDAYQRYRSEMLGREFEETEKERKRREKELEKINKHNDDYEEREAQGVAMWGDNALGKNKPQLGPTAEELNVAGHSATGLVKAGAATLEGHAQAPEGIDIRDINASRTQRAVERIKNETDDKHNLWNMLGIAKHEDLGSQADDIKVENYIPQSVKNNDKNTINTLDQKINRGRTLTPDEEVQYSEAKLRELYKQYPGLEKLMTERNDYYGAYNAISNEYDKTGTNAKRSYLYTAQDKLRGAEEQIKQLTGWSDDELKSVLMYANRSKNREDTLADSKRFEIDPNATLGEQATQGLKNTAYALYNNRGMANLDAWIDNKYSERPKGFGADIDSSAYRKINNSNSAIAATRDALGKDAATIGSAFGEETGKMAEKSATWLYDTAYSAGDSMVGQIPGILAQAAASNIVGPAAGKYVGEAVGLVPFFFKAYNQGYMEARQRGATEDEAQMSANTSGAIEVLTEILPMGNYLDNTAGKNASKSFIKTFIKQAREEGMEEAVGDIVSEVADWIIFKDDPEVKHKFEQRVEETGSYAGAIKDLVTEVISDYASGFLSSAPSSLGSQAIGAHNYGKMTQDISQKAQEAADSIKGDTAYEKSVKSQMEQYAKNPTRYIADNLAENSDEDRQRKAEVMELANKEANGEELTAGEKLFVEEAMRESEESEAKAQKEGKVEEKAQEPSVPLKYQDRVSNWTEDEARTRLAEAAKAGDAQAYVEAMQMTRNSSNKSVAENAEQIISDYAGMAQSHGISQQAIGQAMLSQKKSYIAGLQGEKLDTESMSDENKMAYNEGQMDALKAKERTIIEKDALTNTEVETKNGRKIKLDGVFNAEGKIKSGDDAVRYEDLNLNEDNAVMKAYKAADSYENVNVKNAFLSLLKDGQNVDFYAKDFATIFDSAMAGVSLENTMKSFANQRLDKETVEQIYDVAQRERGARAANYLSEMFTGVKGGKGHVINESSSQDKDMLEAAQMIAGATGLDLRLIDPSDSEKQGSFKKSESTITVRTDDFMRALGHELAEFTEAYNKEAYDVLRNAVANFASEKFGNDKFLLLMRGDENIGYKGYAGTYKEHNLDSSSDEMSGEMFNDVVPIILGSKKGRKAFAEFLAKNYQAEEAKTIGEQAVDYMKRLGKMIKNVFADMKHHSIYANKMQKYADELGDKYAEEFLQALEGAIANYQKAPKVENAEKGESNYAISVDESVYEDGDGTEINGRDLFGEFRLYNLEQGYEEYKKNPSKFAKTKGGDVIIPVEGIGGGIDIVAIVDSNDKVLISEKLYVISDEAYDRDVVAEVIITGEQNGAKNSLFETVNEAICGGQGFVRYIRDNYKTADRVQLDSTRVDGFKNNGFGRNSLNRKGLNSQSTGSSSSVAQRGSRSLAIDSDGNSLSQDQIQYFNQSKVRDKNGSLLVMHHGTSAYGFDVFDIKKASAAGLYGKGFYFSNEASHAGQYGQTYDVYLNIVNPLTPGTKTITDQQLLKFINAIANDEDYGIENYGQDATPQSILKSLKGKDDFSALQDLNATCIGDFASALKLFNNINGTSYDGIMTPTETVAFYSNQIKDINNKKPTSSDNINFSISVDESNQIKKKAKKSKSVDVTPNLIAVHNLGEEQLKETLKLQGLPSPSIAIIKSGMMHDKYGEISLVFNSDTIDPKKSAKNKVYGGDGWTPTFPRVEVKINRKVAEKIWDKIDSLVSETEQRAIGYANIDSDNMEDKANRNRGDIVDAYRDNRAIQYAFLKDNGIELDIPMTDARLDDRFTNEQVLAAAKVIKDLKQAEELRGGYHAYENNPELVEELRKALNDQFREKYADSAKKFKVLDKDLYEELSFSDFDFLTRGVYRYYKNGITQQMDSVEAKRAINAAISEHEKEYNKWLQDLFKDVIEKRGLRNNRDVFLPSGNRRSWEALHDEYNLENIVKIMNQQNERGEAAFFSQSAIQALATKNFKSLDDIRAAAKQLYEETEEEHEARVNAQSERFTEICNEIMDKSESNSFIAFGRASDAIADAIREGKTVRGIDRVLREYRGLNIHEDTAQEIVDLMSDIAENPTGYFEAKPKRAVWLDEIQKAIIPDNVSDELIEALKEAGIPYEMYRYEDEGMRRDILSSLEDIKFSVAVDDDRVFYARGTEVIKNPTDTEYKQMREDIYNQRPWMREWPGEPIMRHTYDEEGNTYYWDAAAALHYSMEPEINKHYNTRTSQHWEWWLRDDKDDYPVDYSKQYSLNVDNIMDNIDDFVDYEILEDIDDIEDAELSAYEEWAIAEVQALMDEMKSVAEVDDVNVKTIRAKHLLRSMLGQEFASKDGKKVAFTEERIDKLLHMYASTNKEYAQAYLTYMSPADYLLLTTNGNDGTRSLDRIKDEATPLDVEELRSVYDTQPIFLDLAEKGVGRATKNEITGHEGRHRMYALQLAGYNQIPVLVFNYANKYDKQAIDSISVYPQAFNEDVHYGKANMVELKDLQPLSTGNEENVRTKFGGEQPADLRLSLAVDNDGRDLTDGQIDYFCNSANVDENGALRRMYHGTDAAGFTAFDPEASDDHISLFFTDDMDMAHSYIRNGVPKRVDVNGKWNDRPIESVSDAIEFLKDAGYTDIEKNDEGWAFNAIGGSRQYLRHTDEELIDRADRIRRSSSGSYEVYLNLENPMVIDAKGHLWNRLMGLHNGDSFRGDFGVGTNTAIDLAVRTMRAEGDNIGFYEVISDEAEIYDVWDIDQIADEFGKDFATVVENAAADGKDVNLNSAVWYEGARKMIIPNDTRGAAFMAYYGGYDGVIIKNVLDNGGGVVYTQEPANIAIAFYPDQVKDINNLNPTRTEDIRYALDLDDEGGFVDFDNVLGTTERMTEAKAVDILEKGMEALKNKEVDLPKLRTLALKLRNEFGSSYNTNTLTENLRKAFAFMQTEDHVDYNTMLGILKDIARPVIEESNEKIGEQEYKDFLEYFKDKKIKLTSKQKEEVKYTYGSYKAFRNAIMPITISDNADTTLDQLWDEMVEQTGFVLDRDVTEGDMPAHLLDTLQAMRPTMHNIYGGDIEDVSRDLAMRIIEEYLEGQAAKEMHKEAAEYRARLKKDYDERRKELKGQVNAELRARNKRRGEQAKEREDARRLRNDIKAQANKLLTWIEKPTEGKSVPHNMVVPVMQFLQAFDFVDPVIKVNDDGKYYTKIFDHVDLNADNHPVKFYYNDITGDTREEVIQKYNEAIGKGQGSKDQRSWAEKMQGIRDIYNRVLRDADFEDTSMDFLMQGLDAQGLAEELDDLLSRNKGELSMNHLIAADLDILDKVIKNIFHAVNQGNKAYSQPSVDIVNLAQSTIQDAEGKEIKSRNKYLEGIYKMFRLDNVTPRTFFKLLGRRSIEIYKFMRDGLNQEILDLKQASDFMTQAMEGIDATKWTGRNATIHEFAVSDGTIRMTDGQIMGLYCTIRRQGGMERIKGGIRVGDIYTKGTPIRQKAMHLTDADIAKIEAVLTPEQIEVAKKMQKYMAEDCSKQGNETSQKLYGFKKFTDPTYYPWSVDRDTVATTNSSENIPMFTGIERSGFTKQLKEGATNPLVINDIFDVFTDHVASMAAYHGYAAAVKDTLRWMNYREQERKDGFVHWITNKSAINTLSGSTQGVGYIRNLLLDINQANKSQYIGGITDILMGNYKAAAVGANLRVVAQQPTAYFRALNMIDPKYLFSVNPKTAIKNIKVSQEQCPISWWKSKGYYETNLGQPIKEIVTGIASPIEKVKDKLMAPAGYADDFTWGFLYTAVEKEQRDKFKGQDISEEEFRKAVNDRFDELVDNTQVVDSTLHRSQYMRSKDALNKIQTAFMAEPTKSYNMLLEAGIEDLNDKDKTMKRTRRAAGAFLLSALATSAAAAVVDAMRKAGDDDDWWEVWLKNLKENMADNMNPFNLLPIVKDVSAYVYNLITGKSTYGMGGSRFDTEAISSLMGAISSWIKLLEGENNKTAYGFIMANIKPLSQITGIPLYNFAKDTTALYNTFFTNIESTLNSENAGRTEQKKDFVSDVNREKSEKILDEGIVSALEHGVSIYDLKGALESEYKNKYFEAYAENDMEAATDIANKAARAYARMGLSDEEIDKIINEWQEEVVTYAELDRAIANGEGILEAVTHVRQAKDDDKIIKHLVDRYAETLTFEDTHDTESHWRENVERALWDIDPTTDFDEVKAKIEQKESEQADKAATSEKNNAMKSEFYDAVEAKDGVAGRRALETMKSEGVEAKSVKTSISTRYHNIWKEAQTQAEKDKAKSDWKSAYTLVDNVYNTKSKNLDKTWSDWEKEQD